MNEDDVDVALNAILEIRAELEAVVAKFPDTIAAKDILSKHGVHADVGLSIQKIDAQVKYLQSEKRCSSTVQKVLSDHENKSLVKPSDLVFLKRAIQRANKIN